MPEELKTFEAVFAEWMGLGWRRVTIDFCTECESDALQVAKDIALLGGNELIFLFHIRSTTIC
jgi:hypothetical protein